MLRACAGVAELRAGCCLMMSSTERKLLLSSSFQLSPEMATTPLFVSIRPQLQPVIPVCIQICPELVFTGLQGSFGHTVAIRLKERSTYSNLLRPTGLPNVFLRRVSRMPNAAIAAQPCQCSTTHITSDSDEYEGPHMCKHRY